MSARLDIEVEPAPTAEQAAAILSAVEATLAAEVRPSDPQPAAYRSLWRAAAVREGRARRTSETRDWRGR